MKIITAHVEMHVIGEVEERDVKAAVAEAMDEMVFDLGLNVVEMSTIDATVEDGGTEEEDEQSAE